MAVRHATPGPPAISDPGARLVAAAAAAGGPVTRRARAPPPRSSALVVSGLPTERFCVEGFLPRQGRRAHGERLGAIARRASGRPSLLEAPGAAGRHPGRPARAPAATGRGGRGRELTKLHEEVWRGSLAERGDAFARTATCAARSSSSSRAPRRPSRPPTTRSPPPSPPRSPTGAGVRQRRRRGGGRARRRPPPRLSRRRASARHGRAERTDASSSGRRGGAGTLASVPPFFLTTPIYYVNDVPARRPRLHDGQRGRHRRWHRLLGDDVFFLTGHRRARRQDRRGRGRATGSPRSRWADRTAARFREAWAGPRHRQRRLHPDDRAPAPPGHPARSLQAVYDNGYIELGHLPRPVLRVLRGLLHRGPAGRRQVPGARPPRHRDGRGQLLLQAERVPGPPDRVVRGEPRGRRAAGQAQRGAQLHPGRPARHLDHAHVASTGASRSPGTTAHVFYVWYDALINYLTAVGYGSDEARCREVVAGRAPPDRQGDHPLPLRVVAGDVHGRRDRPAGPRLRARVAARSAARSCPRP